MIITTSLKEKILSLRNEGKTYDEITKVLGCTKSTVSFHCNNNNIGGNFISKQRAKLTEIEIEELNNFYKDHTIEECMSKFNLGKSTVIKHTENKYIKLSDKELKIRNYQKVKNFRQKLKEKAIDYKGGCCEKCGYDRCDSALEFHHLDPKEKDFGIGSYSVLSWEKVKVELDKCIMVCANCHREIHSNENKLYEI
jgi:DNA-binding CsgD family transcriptional regulator